MAPPSPTKSESHMRPLSTAAGTVHTSALSAAPSVPHTPPVRWEKRDQHDHPSSRPTVAHGSHDASSLPTVTPSAASLSASTPASFPPSPDAPLVLPTEIGRALAYAPPDVQSSVMSLFRSLFLRSASGSGTTGHIAHRRPGEASDDMHIRAEVDSGLRMYNDGYVPPPEYTTH
ncbi:hypothetical protein C8T65DRAFT_828096 [Cerioporus squamosus]|nr:hypothetical protein C8T65DRAFT_828096 [Cerioporus squamosus]